MPLTPPSLVSDSPQQCPGLTPPPPGHWEPRDTFFSFLSSQSTSSTSLVRPTRWQMPFPDHLCLRLCPWRTTLQTSKDITRWCRECIPCQASKSTRHTVPELQEIPVPHRHFTEVNLDLVGPLPPSQGYRYLLTMIDRPTRWFECLELNDITASSVVSGFLRAWVSRYSVPVTIVTD